MQTIAQQRTSHADVQRALRIGIDLYPLCRQMTGIGIYIKYLLRELLAEPDFNFVYPMTVSPWWWIQGRKQRIAEHLASNAISTAVRCFPGAEIAGRVLPMQWGNFGLNLYHITNTLCWFQPSKQPTVVTAHDLAWMRLPPAVYPRPRHLDLGRYPKLLRNAREVLCVSESTKRDVAELAGVPEERLSVTSLAARPEFRPPANASDRLDARQKLSAGRAYFLALGTLERRKNYLRLIEAFAALARSGATHRLIIVGGFGPETDAIRQAIRRHQLQNDVELRGYASDSELQEYLWGADALVMMSVYEGFGLPVLEAMASGTPVIAADAGSLSEVVGDAGLLADPLDVESIANALTMLASSSELQQKFTRLGLARAAEFSWKRTAQQTADVYRRVCA